MELFKAGIAVQTQMTPSGYDALGSAGRIAVHVDWLIGTLVHVIRRSNPLPRTTSSSHAQWRKILISSNPSNLHVWRLGLNGDRRLIRNGFWGPTWHVAAEPYEQRAT